MITVLSTLLLCCCLAHSAGRAPRWATFMVERQDHTRLNAGVHTLSCGSPCELANAMLPPGKSYQVVTGARGHEWPAHGAGRELKPTHAPTIQPNSVRLERPDNDICICQEVTRSQWPTCAGARLRWIVSLVTGASAPRQSAGRRRARDSRGRRGWRPCKRFTRQPTLTPPATLVRARQTRTLIP